LKANKKGNSAENKEKPTKTIVNMVFYGAKQIANLDKKMADQTARLFFAIGQK